MGVSWLLMLEVMFWKPVAIILRRSSRGFVGPYVSLVGGSVSGVAAVGVGELPSYTLESMCMGHTSSWGAEGE